MFDAVVTQRVKPGKEAEAEALLREVAAATLANDVGCLRYEWYRSDQPGTYILVERWTDRAAAGVHLKAPHLAEFMRKFEACAVEKFSVTVLTPL